MKPEIVGIGVQKCMTSWIHALAGAHPEIVASDPKEVDFFSYFFDHGYRWYEGHFGGPGSVGFESSPSYFHDPRAPGRVAAYKPGMKIIVLLRDPVERAYSNHLHEIIKGHIPACSFSDGLANNPSYVEQGLYATHLGRWLDSFPRENLLCLIAEEIAADVNAAARRVYGFIGVDPDFRSGVLEERRNESDRPRSALLRKTVRAGGDAMRQAGLEEMLINLKKLPVISTALRYNSVSLRDEVPPMTAEDTVRLRDRFAREVADVADLLGRPSLPWPTWTGARADAREALN